MADKGFGEVGGYGVVTPNGEETRAEPGYTVFDDIEQNTGSVASGSNKDAGVLGYAAGLSKSDATAMLADTRFVQDIYDYYYEKEGRTFSNPEDAIEEFYADRSWSNLNTIGILGEASESMSNDNTQNARLARLQTVYEALPNFYEDGGTGASGFFQNAGNLLLDPVNLLGFGFGGAGAKVAARTAAQAGRNALVAGAWGGAKRGAVSEGLAGGIIEGIASGGTQTRDINIGLQEGGYSGSKFAGDIALGAGAGALLGGAFGVAGAVTPLPKWTNLKKGKIGKMTAAWRDGQAEGLALNRQAEQEELSRLADLDTPVEERDVLFSNREKELKADLENSIDQANIDPDVLSNTSVGGRTTTVDGQTVETSVPTLEQILANGVTEGKITQDIATDILQKQEALTTLSAMRNAPDLIVGLRRQADELEAGMGQKVDPENPLGNQTKITNLRRQADLTEAGYRRYLEALKGGDPAEINTAVSVFNRAANEFDADGNPTGNTPDGTETGPDFYSGEGGTSTDGPSAQRAAEGNRTQLEGDQTEALDGPEKREALTDESRKEFVELADGQGVTAVPEGPRIAPEADVELNGRITDNRRLEGEITDNLKVNEKRINSIRKKNKRGTATQEELTELSTLQADRKTMLADKKQAKTDADAAQDEFDQKVSKANRVEETSKEADTIAEETATANEVNTDDALPDIDDGIIANAGSEANTVNFLQAIDPSLTEASIRVELRQVTKGLKGTAQKNSARVKFLRKKVDEYQAKARVGEAFNQVFDGGEATALMPFGHRVFSYDLIEALLRVNISKAADEFPTDEAASLAMEASLREYNKYLDQNAVNLFTELVDGLGDDFSLSEVLNQVEENFGSRTLDILNNKMRGIETVQRSGSKKVEADSIADFSPLEREALNKTIAKLKEEKKELGYNDAFIQMFANQTIQKIRARRADGDKVFRAHSDGDVTIAPHEGSKVVQGTQVINGITYSMNKLGGTQGSLTGPKSSNKHGFTGRLVDTLKRNGEKLTGEMAAYTAMDEASLLGASHKVMVSDPVKFKQTKVTDPVTGKKVTETTGENAEAVLELRRILRDIRKLKKADEDADISEIRQALSSEGLIPNIREIDSQVTLQQIILGSPLSVEQRFPKQYLGIKEGRKRFFAYKLALNSRGDMLSRIPSKKTIDRTDIIGPRSKGEIDKKAKDIYSNKRDYEKIDGVVYQKVEVSPGDLREKTGGTQDYEGGDQVFVDPVSNRFFLTRQDAPMPSEAVDSPQALIMDINNAVQRLIKSTEVEVKGDAIANKASPEYKAAKLVNEIKRASDDARLEEAKGTAFSKSMAQSHRRTAKKLKKELRELDPQAWSNRKWVKKGIANLERGADEGIVPDKQTAMKDLETTFDTKVTPEDKAVGRAVADKQTHSEALDGLKNDLIKDATARFESHKDTSLLIREITDIENRMATMSKEAPTTKPKGKAKPMVIEHKGVEVDLNNHFTMVGKPEGTRKIKFMGKVVGRVVKEGDDFEIHTDDIDQIVVLDNEYEIKREFLKVFDKRIKLALEDGALKASDLAPEGSGKSFHNPNHKETNTYRNHVEEPDDTPLDVVDEGEEILNPSVQRTMQEFADDIPQGRSLSIGLKSGQFEGRVRHASLKQYADNNSISSVLGKQVNESFTVGHTDPSLKGKARDASFVAIDGAEFSPAPNSVKPTSTGKQNRLIDDPDIEDPLTQPISFDRIKSMEIDQSQIPEMFGSKPLRGVFKYVGEVVEELQNFENMAWNSPHFKTKNDYMGYIKYMEVLNDIIHYHAPHGVKYNNASRHASMQQISLIMRERPVGELNAVMSVLRNISGADSSMPRFRDDPTGYTFLPGSADSNVANTIGVGSAADGSMNTPDFQKVIHEVGHWAYANILTPQEKSRFWERMGDYITDDGVELGKLKERLPGTANNELHSPAEFFAQQFSQFAISRGKAGTPQELMSLWTRVAQKVMSVMERFFLPEKNFVDPKLVPLFERILPDRDFTKNKFKSGIDKFANAKGTRSKYAMDKLGHWETIRNNIEEAIESGDPSRIRSALDGSSYGSGDSFVQEAIAYKGTDGSKTYRNSKGVKKARVRLLDSGSKLGETAEGLPVYKYMNSFHLRNKILRHMREIQQFNKMYPDETRASALTPEMMETIVDRTTSPDEAMRQAEIAAIAKSAADGDLDGIPDVDALGYNDPIADMALSRTDEEASELIITLANRSLNLINEVQVELRRQVGRNFPKTNAGEGLRVSPEGKIVGTKNPVSERFKKQAVKKQKQLSENAESIVADLTKKADNFMDEVLKGKTTAALNNPTGRQFTSVNEMSIPEIIQELSQTTSQSSRTRDLNQGLLNKVNTAPEVNVEGVQFSERDIARVTVGEGKQLAETPADFHKAIMDAKIKGNDRDMALATLGLKRLFQETPDVLPKTSMVNRALDIEIKQTKGSGEDNGIPNGAKSDVKELLRKITHRDKKVEANARLLTYRMMNLMGKTQQDATSNANFLSVEDVSKLFGEKAPDGAYGVFQHATDGVQFNQLRKTARKLGMSLKKGKSGTDFIGIRPNTKGQEYTAVHEIGHMLVRGSFDDNRRQVINQMYEASLRAGDKRASQIADRFSNYRNEQLSVEGVNERLAEEWFVDGFANYLGNRIAKKDMFGNVRLKNRLETMVDGLIEQVMYVVNGIMGNKKLRQQYRYLTFGGDMMANKSALKTPVRNAVRNTGMYSMTNDAAPKYARETIDNYSPERDIAAREFVGAREHENLMEFVYYHGTPNGGAFERAANADVQVEPSSTEALFGEGIYLTKVNALAEDYSYAGHRASLRAMIDGEALSVARKNLSYEYADGIARNREEIANVLTEMDGTSYRNVTRRRAEEINKGNEQGVAGDPAFELLKMQKRLEVLYQQEKKLWTLFEGTSGVKKQPKVLPLLVRAEDTFNFDANTFYSIGGSDNNISWLIAEMGDKNFFPQKVGVSVIEELRSNGEFAGDDLYEIIIENLKRSGTSDEEAKMALTSFMRDMGYDSFRVTELDPITNTPQDAMLVFDSTQVKHVDADGFDSDMPNMYADKIGTMQHGTLSGKIMEEQIDFGRNIDPGDMVGVGVEAQRLGVPDALQGFIRRSLRKEEPTVDDFEAIQRHSGQGKGGNWIRENSVHLRRIGAKWFANIVKPEGGAGIFQKINADMSKKVGPLMNSLRMLPDAQGAGKRWLKKSQGLVYFANKKLGTSTQPASHERIITALRQQDLSRLSAQERQVAMQINEGFKAELASMQEHGIPIGDLKKKLGQKFYVPQVWDIGFIKDNPGKFNELLTKHFMKEQRQNGFDVNQREAAEISQEIIKRMLDTDGRIDVDDVLSRRMSQSGNPFMQRFITLTPDEIPEMSEYMVRDLEGILARYFDRSSRTIGLAREFGVRNQAAEAYMEVAANGTRGAVNMLTGAKTTTRTMQDMGAAGDIHSEIVPRIIDSPDEAEKIVGSIVNVMGNTSASKNANKQRALNLLLGSIDVTRLDKQQYNQFKLRAKAIVNGLADFDVPTTGDNINWMTEYMNVLNRKPLGSDRAYSYSRKLRTFNSVTLLSYTTLTSFPDIVLPLVRSGRVGSWMKGWSQRWLQDPSYKQAARDIGVGIENLIHDNMTHMAGDGSQKFTHAFFNATGLTPWTNMQREVAALVGFNAIKAEADALRRLYAKGITSGIRFDKSKRFLERYGMLDYGQPSGPRLDDIRKHTQDDNVRYAIMRFTNEAIFTPDPNDVPMWAQTPWGSTIFQLKSFPIMMGRMAKDVTLEAKKGNIAPLMLMLTAGSGFGMGANAGKDLILARGEDETRTLRDRTLDKTPVGKIFEMAGVNLEDSKSMNTPNELLMGATPNEFLGWWVEGLMAMGGLGLIAEFFFNATEQVDQGAYGKVRMFSTLGGPSVGILSDAIDVSAGALEGLEGGEGRQAVRRVIGRTPVLGGIKDVRESIVDYVAGEAKTRGGGGSSTSWISTTNWVGMPPANTKKR